MVALHGRIPSSSLSAELEGTTCATGITKSDIGIMVTLKSYQAGLFSPKNTLSCLNIHE